jgi:hypothetical protein
MKIRNGFVSNSSSSSFLIGVPMGVETLDEFIYYFCGSENNYIDEHKYIGGMNLRDVAIIIYGMIEGTHDYIRGKPDIGSTKLIDILMFSSEVDKNPTIIKLEKEEEQRDYDQHRQNMIYLDRQKVIIKIIEKMPSNLKYHYLTTGDQSIFRNWIWKNHEQVFKNLLFYRWLD